MNRDSFSQCHPLVNFIYFVAVIGFGVVVMHPLWLFCGILGASAYYLLLKGMRALKLILVMVPVFFLIALVNPLFNHDGEQILCTVFGNPYTLEALLYGIALASMFLLMLLWFGCYSQVLTSDKFICLFGRLIPALSLLLVMVLRMIPGLTRKASQISNARKAIGKGMGNQSTRREKLAGGMLILSSLTDWALEGSIVTADSMRARGYGSGRRTSFRLYRMTGRDLVLLTAILLLTILSVLTGDTAAAYTPTPVFAPPTPGLIPYCILLMIPTVLHLKEAIQWHISISRI